MFPGSIRKAGPGVRSPTFFIKEFLKSVSSRKDAMPPRQDHPTNPLSEPAQIFVCRGPQCGGEALVRVLASELKRAGLGDQVQVQRHPCRGLCLAGPTVTLMPRGILYCRVKPDDVAE